MSSELKNATALEARRFFREAVRRALLRAGFEEKEHNGQLQQALGISYSATYRKLNLDAGWTDTDLAAIAHYLNQPLERLLDTTAIEVGPSTSVFAQVHLAGKLHACTADVGPELEKGEYSEFVLLQDMSGTDQIVPLEAGDSLARARKVYSFTVESSQQRLPSIAVLEDDSDALELACEILRQRRFSPVPFQSIEELETEVKSRKFDVIVLDWWVNGKTSEGLIKEIRESRINRDCELVIITGELVNGGKASEESLERLITRYRIKTHIKPVRWPLLAAEWAN